MLHMRILARNSTEEQQKPNLQVLAFDEHLVANHVQALEWMTCQVILTSQEGM